MTFGVRLRELQAVVRRYGAASIEAHRRACAIGDAIISGFENYLGEGAEVIGVPPRRDWDPELGDYCDAKFSSHRQGLLLLEPIEMGLAIRLPNLNNVGVLWLRVVVTLEKVGDTVSVWTADGEVTHIEAGQETGSLDVVYERIFAIVKAVFDEPAATMSTPKRSIGFIDFRYLRSEGTVVGGGSSTLQSAGVVRDDIQRSEGDVRSDDDHEKHEHHLAPTAKAPNPKRGRHPAFGAMKGTFTIAPGVDLTEPAMPEWADMIGDKYGKEPRRE